MQVAALAETLDAARRPDGAISLHELQANLRVAGLEEFADAVAAFAKRVNVMKQELNDTLTPWF